MDVELANFDDKKWVLLNLRHDWKSAMSSQMYNTNFSDSIGWYRKEFMIPLSAKNRITWMFFDGKCGNYKVWINGALVGLNINSSTSFNYDLTSHLRYGEKMLSR